MVRRKKLLSGVLLLSVCYAPARVMAQQWLYKQAAVPIEYRVKDLLGRMTIEEKVGQLCCPLGWEMYTKTGKNEVTVSELYKKKMAEAPVGSFWAVLRADPWTQKTLETGLVRVVGKSIECTSKICCGRNEAGYSGFVCRGVPTWTHGYRNYRISHSFVGCQYLERGADVENGGSYCPGSPFARGEHWLWSGAGCCSRAALVTHGGNLWGRPSADYHHGSGYDEGNAR